jgi:hypothetical protein
LHAAINVFVLRRGLFFINRAEWKLPLKYSLLEIMMRPVRPVTP